MKWENLNLWPVDRIDIAQPDVLLNPHGTARHAPQTPQSEVLEVLILEDDDCIVVEQGLATDDGQVRKHGGQRPQPVDSIYQ